MAQDPTTSSVSTPDGEVYPSSEEVRAADAEKLTGEEDDVETETSEEEAEGSVPEEESVSEGDGDEEADSGEGEPEETVAEGEAAEEADAAGVVEEPVAEDDGAVDEVEEGLDEHEHEVPNPMTYHEAQEKLEEIPYQELREMAEADGLKPERSKKGVIVQLLSAWFPPPPSVPGIAGQPMSARIRRIKESQQQ